MSIKKVNANQITTDMKGGTLEIFIDGKIAAEVSDGSTELEFVYDILQGMGYEINEDNFELRSLKPIEEFYTYRQSQQIYMQTGFIGYMRTDFGPNGKGFFSTWTEFNNRLKTPEFAEDLDFVINDLRSKDCMFHNRDTLGTFCAIHPEWKLNADREYCGVRVDTTNYTYMLRFTPRQGDCNIYCHCYKRDRLNNHLEAAERGIGFIDSSYNELFRIADGDSIRITMDDGKTIDRDCRYIDQYHVEIGSQLYHICQFAEMMEKNKNTVIPLRASLPNMCYIFIEDMGCLGVIMKGERGCRPTAIGVDDSEKAKDKVCEMNAPLRVDEAQLNAMIAGSTIGWGSPEADPRSYKNGTGKCEDNATDTVAEMSKKENVAYWDEIDHAAERYVEKLIELSTKKAALVGSSYTEEDLAEMDEDELKDVASDAILEIGKEITEFAINLLEGRYGAKFPYVEGDF